MKYSNHSTQVLQVIDIQVVLDALLDGVILPTLLQEIIKLLFSADINTINIHYLTSLNDFKIHFSLELILFLFGRVFNFVD